MLARKGVGGKFKPYSMQLFVMHIFMEILFMILNLKYRPYVLTAIHILLYFTEKCHVFQNTLLFKACSKAFQADILSRSSDTFQ